MLSQSVFPAHRRVSALLLPLLFLSQSPARSAELQPLTIENHSAHRIKAAAPGAKAVRIPAGAEPVTIMLDPEAAEDGAHGVEVKAWWSHNPRQLCIIFTRFGGVVKVHGETEIRCLGN